MKKFSTKKALVLSVLSLCLCLAMLLGTTFAWFTDEVTSSGNIIQTGTLKVGMYWVEGDEVVPAKGDAAWIDASKGAMFNNTLWEPGYVEAKHIMIANEGTLALNYKLRIVANGVVSKLSDVIDVYYFETAEQLTRDSAVTGTKIGTLTDILGTNKNLTKTVFGSLTAGETRTLTLALKMQETAGNEYQNLSIGADFSIQLIATQMASEEDSFDAYYDQFVTNPEMPAALVRPMTDLTIDTTGSTLGVDLGEFDLAAGYQFEPTADLANAMNSDYRFWHADFVVSADRDVLANTIVLAGYYDAWCSLNNDKWVALTADTDIAAGTEVRLVGSLPMNVTVNWEALCEFGNDGTGFLCGLAAADADALAKLAGTTVTVELRVYEVPAQGECATGGGCKHPYSDCETGESFVLGTFKYTFPAFEVAGQNELDAALTNGAKDISVAAGTYTFPASKLTAGTTLYCEEDTVFEGKTSLNINGATVVGATFTSENSYLVNQQTINGTFKDCTFTDSDGLRYCYAGETVVFENCVFDTDFYGVHFDGGANDVTFKNCTFSGFNTFGSAITKLTLENCTFKYNGHGGYNGVNLWGNSELTNCTFVFDGSASYEWVDLCHNDKTVTFTNCVVTDGTNNYSVADYVGNYGDNNTIIVDGVMLNIPNMS